MVKNKPVSSMQDLRSIFLDSKVIYISLEDYVTPERGHFRHQPYAFFSCFGNDPQTKKRVRYFVRHLLFPTPAFMTFDDYSFNAPDAISLQMLIEAMAKATQELLDIYFFASSKIRDSYGLRYVMNTEEIKIKTLKKK